MWIRLKSTYKYKYYRSIDFLPVFNFFKIIETEDKRYLIKLKDYELLPKTIDQNVLNQIWDEIQNQYSEKENSNIAVIQFTLLKGIHKMELECLMLWNILTLLNADYTGIKAQQALKDAGIENKGVKWIEKRIKVLSNKIRIKRKGINNEQAEKLDYWTIFDEIEDAKGRSIDMNKTTVRQYIAIKHNIRKNGERQNRAKGHNRHIST